MKRLDEVLSAEVILIQTNLEKSPQYIEQAKVLIESSFGYSSNHSFAVDFYPLFNPSNFKHCHILIDNDQVIAHIGTKQRTLKSHKLNMYGGIAINAKYRGRGIFKDFFNSIVTMYSNCALHLLWSDKLELYKKFGFHPAGELYQYTNQKTPHHFTVEEISWSAFQNANLYESASEVRLDRTLSDWEDLKKIKSCEIYIIKYKQKTVNYFVRSKGADLEGIIHEYGFINKEQLQCMQNHGTVWSPQKLAPSQTLFGTVVKPGELSQFNQLVQMLSKLTVDGISDDLITFQFNQSQVELSHAEFLIGVLGPNRFEELENLPPIFISGLDSI